jgi:hypothetical protein
MIERRIYQLRIRTDFEEYIGTFYSPFPNQRLPEVIGRIEGYINLKNVLCTQSGEKFPFIMVNKNRIETIRVLGEKIEESNIHDRGGRTSPE